MVAAAARIVRHTDLMLRGDEDPAPAAPVLRHPVATTAKVPSAASVASTPDFTGLSAGPSEHTRRILRHAQDFYTAQLAASWAPAYLDSRGISTAIAHEWDIGFAPGNWTALTDHLRRLGCSDDEIETAGVAKRSSRGTLIDRFRDRVMLPVHDERGRIAGFIGRAHPDAGDGVPKYLNSPETAGFRKGSLLFGLARARPALAQGAVPVIVEGPFDAIAVTLADPDRHAGLAPCGTALTSRQAELLSQAADLPRTGILVAFDPDAAGRRAAVRAYGILRPYTPRLLSAQLNGEDPAEIFRQNGATGLRAVLRGHHELLSAVLIDAHIEGRARYLGDTEGRYRVMRSTAALVAGRLPSQIAAQISQFTEGRDLVLLDDMLHPVDNPQLPRIARVLPADAAYQVMRTAGLLNFDASEVLAEVANAVTRGIRFPKGQRRALLDLPIVPRLDRDPAAPVLASGSFPRAPLAWYAGAAPPTSLSRAGRPSSRPRPVGRAR
jgi:DNA primase